MSVIVISKDEETVIEQCLRSIFLQTYPRLELVLVDSSQDKTFEIITRLRGETRIPITIVRVPALGAGYARNIGLENASGEIVSWVDADETIPPEYIEQGIMPLLNNGDLLAVFTPRILPSPRGRFSKLLFLYTNAFTFTGLNFDIPRIYRKEFYKIVGGYDSSLRSWEDIELMVRAKTKIDSDSYNKVFGKVAVSHLHNWQDKSGLAGHFKISMWSGEGFANLFARYPRRYSINFLEILYLSLVPIFGAAFFLGFHRIISLLLLLPFLSLWPYSFWKIIRIDMKTVYVLAIPFLMIYKAYGHIFGIFKQIYRTIASGRRVRAKDSSEAVKDKTLAQIH